MNISVTSTTFPITFSNAPKIATSTIYGSTDNRITSTVGYNSGLFAISGASTTTLTRTGTADGIRCLRHYIAIGY